MAFSWNSADEPEARYIIIGNGFDLECGLRTGYRDFLSFVRCLESGDLQWGDTSERQFDWQGFCSNNYWFERYDTQSIGGRWVDFESEIARVVTNAERDMTNEDGTKAFADDDIQWKGLPPILFEAYEKLSRAGKRVETYRDVANGLLVDLQEITRAFEAYLRDWACRESPKETEAVKSLIRDIGACDSSYVISFNYTSTLEQMLESRGISAEFCYVHGLVGDGNGKNGMVLGIDEHLDSGDIEAYVDFGPFRKYNQRVYKRADSSYMNWLEEARQPYENTRQLKAVENDLILSSSYGSDQTKRMQWQIKKMMENEEGNKRRKEVIVFGHSLGITDKDILWSFITLPDTRTVIYYHSEEAFSSQVSNLAAILGVDEVVERTGGANRTLEFRDQREAR